jgi:hypothetical protein
MRPARRRYHAGVTAVTPSTEGTAVAPSTIDIINPLLLCPSELQQGEHQQLRTSLQQLLPPRRLHSCKPRLSMTCNGRACQLCAHLIRSYGEPACCPLRQRPSQPVCFLILTHYDCVLLALPLFGVHPAGTLLCRGVCREACNLNVIAQQVGHTAARLQIETLFFTVLCNVSHSIMSHL